MVFFFVECLCNSRTKNNKITNTKTFLTKKYQLTHSLHVTCLDNSNHPKDFKIPEGMLQHACFSGLCNCLRLFIAMKKIAFAKTRSLGVEDTGFACKRSSVQALGGRNHFFPPFLSYILSLTHPLESSDYQ